MIRKILIGLLLINSIYTFADSPITSTPFYKAFNEIPEINQAEKIGKLNYELASYLASDNNSIDKKLALVNALGWHIDGKNNSKLFELFLKNKYSLDYLDYSKISNDEHLIIGYLTIMDDYNEVVEPLKIIHEALEKNPNSYSYNIIYGLVLSQLYLDFGIRGAKEEEKFLITNKYLKNLVDSKSNSWCNIYMISANIEKNKTLIQDFRESAKKIIFNYTGIYKSNCRDERLILVPSLEKYEIKMDKLKMKKIGGVYQIPVLVNGIIELDFIVDTGASDVHIPLSLFKTLINANKIRREDVIGLQTYSIADGSDIENIKIILRKLEVGNFIVTNVEASVGNDNSPLLLGQSFFQKFENVSVNNLEGTLEIIP
ncbi:retroviral-like aspartic protease family protein [Weeksellaceae bacterium KMM 9724]|uniref:retropepsin-like aspartic protease family protein n=1 Tax=Profundicola chukchiensis TaxID=2961959 RepID=UPI00243A6C4B|nr:retropepsin-like aspartic protease [Profundicola chukchiensis]MDG4950724.1 retroviral-like aspartic protease family protein [Profundicola chukchiensis]